MKPRKPIMFDLGCGLGGASAAMRDRGWAVYRLDWSRDVKADRYCDIRSLLTLPRGIDLLWVSTSCQQFTLSILPFKVDVNARRPIDLSVELHVRRLIDESQPRYWVVENVAASRRYLSAVFGPVNARVAGHVLWGNLPLLVSDVPTRKWEVMKSLSGGRRKHLIASKVPYELSEAVARTIESLV